MPTPSASPLPNTCMLRHASPPPHKHTYNRAPHLSTKPALEGKVRGTAHFERRGLTQRWRMQRRDEGSLFAATHHRHMITVALHLAEQIQYFICLGEPAHEPHPSSEHNSLANAAPPVLLFGHSSFHYHVHKHAHSINNYENG